MDVPYLFIYIRVVQFLPIFLFSNATKGDETMLVKINEASLDFYIYDTDCPSFIYGDFL